MKNIRKEPDLLCYLLNQIPYSESIAIQTHLAEARREGVSQDMLLLLEHPPVYTTGRRFESAELPMGNAFYEDRGIEIFETDRGGRVTYHGPGQLVGYPIISLKPLRNDVHNYIRLLEKVVISLLAEYGVATAAREGLTGVWVGDRKIASIGIHVSRGITTHGFAINAANDLQPFEWIVPCGIEGCQVTSIYKETGESVDMSDLRERCAESFASVFERTLKYEPDASPASLLTNDAVGSLAQDEEITATPSDRERQVV